MSRVKAVDVIVTSKDHTITRASRALVTKRTKVKVPAQATAEQVTAILADKGITARVVTWAKANNRQLNAAAKAKAEAL